VKLCYMVEYSLRDHIRKPRYDPNGVWVQGLGPGLDLVNEFLPGQAEAREDIEWLVNCQPPSGCFLKISWPTTSRRCLPIAACVGA